MIIQTEFQQVPFVAVPRDVIKMVGQGLSAEALGVLVWLAARPVGAQVQVPTIQRAFGVGKDKWQRIARELRAVGALIVEPLRCNETNKVYGKAYLVRWPESRKNQLSENPQKPKAGKSGYRAGKSGHEKPENPAPIKEQRIKEKRAHDQNARKSGRFASPQNAASRPSTQKQNGQAQSAAPDVSILTPYQRSALLRGEKVLIAGAVCDPASQHGAALVAAVRAKSTDPQKAAQAVEALKKISERWAVA